MSLQPMPVLDRLLAKRFDLPEAPRQMVEFAWGSVKVRADAAADMYWQTPKEVWSRETDFPPVRLPFPAMWIEWDQPSSWITDGGKIVENPQTMLGDHLAVLVRHLDREVVEDILTGGEHDKTAAGARQLSISVDEAVESYAIYCFMLREGVPGFFPRMGIVHVDSSGKSLREIVWAGAAAMDTQADRSMTDMLHAHFGKLALLAIGLMNCKNVDLTEHISKVPIGRRQRRRNGGIKYHTIDIPGHNSVQRGSSSTPAAHAMHRVRGHFKTFTSSAPLMGKHVGTYWWGWQIRGNKSNGTNVGDYRIGVSA